MQGRAAGNIPHEGYDLGFGSGLPTYGTNEQAHGAVGGNAQAFRREPGCRIVRQQQAVPVFHAKVQGFLFAAMQGVERGYGLHQGRGFTDRLPRQEPGRWRFTSRHTASGTITLPKSARRSRQAHSSR